MVSLDQTMDSGAKGNAQEKCKGIPRLYRLEASEREKLAGGPFPVLPCFGGPSSHKKILRRPCTSLEIPRTFAESADSGLSL